MNNEFYQRAYALKHIHRYSMVPVLKPESVAEHSYFVALLVLMLKDKYKFDVDLAIKLAMCHDLAEIEISDVNHLIKKKYPEVAKALHEAEKDIVSTFPDEVREYCITPMNTVEGLIVHYADAYQCHQYSSSEVALGNEGYMRLVKDNSLKRMIELENKLEPYLK